MKSKKINIVFFTWSKLSKDKVKKEIINYLENFYKENKDKINKVIYWWWKDWNMWIVYDFFKNKYIELEWIVLEREIDMWFKVHVTKKLKTDNERIEYFYQNSDLFIALSGWLWTIREILEINEKIKEEKNDKKIIVTKNFEDFYIFIKSLKEKSMINETDLNIELEK